VTINYINVSICHIKLLIFFTTNYLFVITNHHLLSVYQSKQVSQHPLRYRFTATLSKFAIDENRTQWQLDSKQAPSPFLHVLEAKFWSRSDTFIPTPNQSSSPPWIAASTPNTVPVTSCLLVKRLQPLHRNCATFNCHAKRWWSRVQGFCIGLADPSVHELRTCV
jgi:hypothetical protein